MAGGVGWVFGFVRWDILGYIYIHVYTHVYMCIYNMCIYKIM